MATDDWRDRLRLEANRRCEGSRDSYRQISLRAGVNERYLSDIFSKGKMPTVPIFLSITEAMDVSPVYILTGLDMTPIQQEILSIFVNLSESEQEAFLTFARQFIGARQEQPAAAQ